ncbi:MAG: PIG-L family deacetylase [Anaerolineae bacterium]|nr:PIG-L family deacetylase [Anaerolineae bacterium]
MTTRSLMVILAHPDDESFPMGGTLAKMSAEGNHVHLVVATRGEAGIVGKSAAETAVIRETELRQACTELGIQQLTFLDYVDGALANIPDSEGADRLLTLMRQSPPDVVVTFGPDGISGHPDHLAVYRWTTAAFDQYQQEVERPLRLYYITPSEATQQGCGIPPPAEAVGGPVAFIDVGGFLVQKVRAAQQHQSQYPPFKGDPESEAQNMACHELFRLARPQIAANGHGPETDLFAGLNGVNSQKSFRKIT